jgi:hypothetical protein
MVAALLASASLAEAQTSTGRIMKEAPLFLVADANRQPLLIMEAGVWVEVNRREGNWVNVTVEGNQFGRRTGYVEARFIEVQEKQSTTGPLRVTAADTIPPKAAETTTAVPAQPSLTTRSRVDNSRTPPSRATETFQKSMLNVTVEDKTRESAVIVRYEPSVLVIADKNSGVATKTFPYSDVKGGEYSYAKNPRWKTAIFVSPFFLFTSGKKHWFLVQGEGDYALLHLDKTNYRLILAAFEARTGLKVETVTDTK